MGFRESINEKVSKDTTSFLKEAENKYKLMVKSVNSKDGYDSIEDIKALVSILQKQINKYI